MFLQGMLSWGYAFNSVFVYIIEFKIYNHIYRNVSTCTPGTYICVIDVQIEFEHFLNDN